MKTKRVSAAAIAAAASGCLLMWASGCGPSTPDSAQPHTPGNQVAQGGALFVAHCAECHGAQGQGDATKGVPPLVGANALPLDPRPRAELRKNQFRTAQDVFDFVHVSMPLDEPGSLTEDQYWAILAFALHANGVDMRGKRIDASNASRFVLHP
jgi:S-disulfanyl-L-cysteine oxidoreductase SoxD